MKNDSNNNINVNDHQQVDQNMNKTYTRPTSMFINSSMDKRMSYAEENRASSSMSRSRTSSESSEVKDYLSADPVSRASALIASQGKW